MSLYLRLVIGPVVVCDIDLFATREVSKNDDPPPQLAGGTGTLTYPDPLPDEPAVFGFGRRRHPKDKGYSARPTGEPKPPPPPGRGSPSPVDRDSVGSTDSGDRDETAKPAGEK